MRACLPTLSRRKYSLARRTSPRAETSIFSILGECTGNVRSTPTPKDCLRTVKVSRTPSPWRLMTTPSKTCVRRRVPSMTWKWTFTRSPAWKRGTRRSCVRSRESITVLMGVRRGARMGSRGGRSCLRTLMSPAARLLEPPVAHAGMMAGQQHVRNRPAAPLRRARVVGVLGAAAERRREGLLHGAGVVAEHARELAQHGVQDDHRRTLSARQHIAPDRQLLGAVMLEDALVEAFVSAADERQRLLLRQLCGQRVVEQPAA